jgi:biopolymer transport protein ExbD/biopolymer transport protein TolR
MLQYGRHRRGLPVNAEINITNLVDVAFVLLIIFMITAPILQGGIELQLPEAESRPLENSDALVVSVARDGSLFIDRTRVESIEEFEQVVPTLIGGDAKRPVSIKGDRGVEYGRIMEVMGVLMKLEITNVSMAVEPPRRNRS